MPPEFRTSTRRGEDSSSRLNGSGMGRSMIDGSRRAAGLARKHRDHNTAAHERRNKALRLDSRTGGPDAGRRHVLYRGAHARAAAPAG